MSRIPITRIRKLSFAPLQITALCVSLLLLLSGGCGPGRPQATDGGKIVLNYWNGFSGPDGKTMSAMVRQFESENPDIEVHMQIIPWGTYHDKLTLALAYGGAPDVFIMQAARFPEFASFHTLRPVADVFADAKTPLGAKDFAPVPWCESFYRGTQYALPLDTHPIGLYYDTKLFEDAGIVDAQGRPSRRQTSLSFWPMPKS